jgi:hypothetical protein
VRGGKQPDERFCTMIKVELSRMVVVGTVEGTIFHLLLFLISSFSILQNIEHITKIQHINLPVKLHSGNINTLISQEE